MENTNTNESLPAFLVLDRPGFAHLEEVRKWAHFLSIIGFIVIGLIVIMGLFIGSFLSVLGSNMPIPLPMGIISFLYIIIALLYFYPVYYLNRFAANMRGALHGLNQESLNLSLKYLKSLFRFMGILTVIVLSIYVIVFVAFLVFGMFNNFNG